MEKLGKNKNNKKLKKVAVFDIDGTIFRSSLLIEVVEVLVAKGILSEKVKNFYSKAFNDWLARKGSYEEYIGGVIIAFEKNIKGVNYNDFISAAKIVNDFHGEKVYRYTSKLVRKLKKQNYFLLAISNSPKEVASEFCKNWGFDKIYGRIYEIDENKEFTGKTLRPDLMGDKAKILRRAVDKENLTLRKSVGVGDTESDISFLKLVENPICFNPNKKLYETARKHNWKIVVERKDVVYQIN